MYSLYPVPYLSRQNRSSVVTEIFEKITYTIANNKKTHEAEAMPAPMNTKNEDSTIGCLGFFDIADRELSEHRPHLETAPEKRFHGI